MSAMASHVVAPIVPKRVLRLPQLENMLILLQHSCLVLDSIPIDDGAELGGFILECNF